MTASDNRHREAARQWSEDPSAENAERLDQEHRRAGEPGISKPRSPLAARLCLALAVQALSRPNSRVIWFDGYGTWICLQTNSYGTVGYDLSLELSKILQRRIRRLLKSYPWSAQEVQDAFSILDGEGLGNQLEEVLARANALGSSPSAQAWEILNSNPLLLLPFQVQLPLVLSRGRRAGIL